MEIWEFIFHKQHILLLRMLHLPQVWVERPSTLDLALPECNSLLSFSKGLCSPCCVPEPMLDAVNTTVNRQRENPVFMTLAIKKKKKILSLWHSQLPGDAVVKNLYANAGDAGSVPGWGRSPGEGNGNPLQYSCQENSMDRGVSWATVHGVARVRHDWVTEHSACTAWHLPSNWGRQWISTL